MKHSLSKNRVRPDRPNRIPLKTERVCPQAPDPKISHRLLYHLEHSKQPDSKTAAVGFGDSGSLQPAVSSVSLIAEEIGNFRLICEPPVPVSRIPTYARRLDIVAQQSGDMQLLLALLGLCGLTFRETISLRRRDIDWKRQTLPLRQHDSGLPAVDAQERNREIPLPEAVMELIRQRPVNLSGQLFENRHTRTELNTLLRPYHLCLADLRDACIRDFIAAGASPEAAAHRFAEPLTRIQARYGSLFDKS